MWKDKYKIGVELIDDQHKELFMRVSDFIQTIQSKEDWDIKIDKVKETMSFMQEYVVIHFDEEEVYQAKINYPDIEEHKKAHHDFKKAVNGYVERVNKEGYSEDLVKEFGGKLMAWLIMHVARMDQKIGQYASSKGGDIQ